jgi:hypothetical protein
MGGLAGADARCQAAADSSGNPGIVGKRFLAWLSGTEGAAAQRHAHSLAAYAMPDGVIVAGSWNELVTTGPRVAIHVYEDGGRVMTGSRFVWTGTLPNGGSAPSNCSSWTSASPVVDASVGQTGVADGGWTTLASRRPCDQPALLYCVER